MVRSKIGCVDVSRDCDTKLTIFKDHMERFWSNSIFKYLRVEPEDHYFLLTEPVKDLCVPQFVVSPMLKSSSAS